MRPRYGGSASTWGYALYLTSTDEHQDAVLPTSGFTGTPEDALLDARLPGEWSTVPGRSAEVGRLKRGESRCRRPRSFLAASLQEGGSFAR
jgi:hypothetical protein